MIHFHQINNLTTMFVFFCVLIQCSNVEKSNYLNDVQNRQINFVIRTIEFSSFLNLTLNKKMIQQYYKVHEN